MSKQPQQQKSQETTATLPENTPDTVDPKVPESIHPDTKTRVNAVSELPRRHYVQETTATQPKDVPGAEREENASHTQIDRVATQMQPPTSEDQTLSAHPTQEEIRKRVSSILEDNDN